MKYINRSSAINLVFVGVFSYQAQSLLKQSKLLRLKKHISMLGKQKLSAEELFPPSILKDHLGDLFS